VPGCGTVFTVRLPVAGLVDADTAESVPSV